ncbi:Alpha/Beta hydrolase protein [Mycena floridula]|nr:Alpha/Beta hydrolase protein [Mycena floridula]
MLRSLTTLFFLALLASAQTPPSSFPHRYPAQPTGPLGVQWQSYYQVTAKLPNITFDLSGRHFAGNIPVERAGHPNDTLFFWAFEKENGSLTDAASTEPWGIWLNGGPGSSSLYGLFFENGPIHIEPDYTATKNNFSWHEIADYIWIDQPVGTGFSTADTDGYIADDDQMGEDFMGFLANLVKVFPSLATRPLHLSGESYAGVWIPYIMKAYFAMTTPPVNIAKIAIGDGSIASGQVFELLPTLNIIETYPQLIGYDTASPRSGLCGYDLNLTYPQNGIIPSVPLLTPIENPDIIWEQRQILKQGNNERELQGNTLTKRDQESAHEIWKRDLSGRANGTIDPWYGCILLTELIDYAINFTFPWTLCQGDPNQSCFDVYSVPDALDPEVNRDASVFLNDPRTRAALHAPTSKDWAQSFSFPYGNLTFMDPSPEPMVFLTDLATNATAKNVGVVIYSGNDDTLIAHRGSEGFTRKPSTPWTDDSGAFAGIVHQERNWTYVLFHNAGHLVPQTKPAAALTFLREFFFGSNTTGLVTTSPSGTVAVVGGEDPSLVAGDVMAGSDEIFYGSGATQSTHVFPSATIAAWRAFIQTATVTPGAQDSKNNAASGLLTAGTWMFLSLVSGLGLILL